MPSGIIEQSMITAQLLSSDPDFREIVTVLGRADSSPDMAFNRYPFDQSFQSRRFAGHEVEGAIAVYRALMLWEEGMIPHLPEQ